MNPPHIFTLTPQQGDCAPWLLDCSCRRLSIDVHHDEVVFLMRAHLRNQTGVSL